MMMMKNKGDKLTAADGHEGVMASMAFLSSFSLVAMEEEGASVETL